MHLDVLLPLPIARGAGLAIDSTSAVVVESLDRLGSPYESCPGAYWTVSRGHTAMYTKPDAAENVMTRTDRRRLMGSRNVSELIA